MNKKRLILWILVALTVAFIFGQSLLDQQTSSRASSTVKIQVVEPIQKVITGRKEVRIHSSLVRDIAHVFEFAVLGFEVFFLVKNCRLLLCGLRSVSYCGFIALVDESMQYLSDRSPQVIDIWHDIMGAVIGSIISILVVFAINKRKAQKDWNNQELMR